MRSTLRAAEDQVDHPAHGSPRRWVRAYAQPTARAACAQGSPPQFRLDRDLDVAAELALQTMLDLMQRVTQVVNQTKGVHAVLRDAAPRR
jgi:hypothetical protein